MVTAEGSVTARCVSYNGRQYNAMVCQIVVMEGSVTARCVR